MSTDLDTTLVNMRQNIDKYKISVTGVADKLENAFRWRIVIIVIVVLSNLLLASGWLDGFQTTDWFSLLGLLGFNAVSLPTSISDLKAVWKERKSVANDFDLSIRLLDSQYNTCSIISDDVIKSCAVRHLVKMFLALKLLLELDLNDEDNEVKIKESVDLCEKMAKLKHTDPDYCKDVKAL